MHAFGHAHVSPSPSDDYLLFSLEYVICQLLIESIRAVQTTAQKVLDAAGLLLACLEAVDKVCFSTELDSFLGAGLVPACRSAVAGALAAEGAAPISRWARSLQSLPPSYFPSAVFSVLVYMKPDAAPRHHPLFVCSVGFVL